MKNHLSFLSSNLRATRTQLLGFACASLLLLCGAGSVPIKNLVVQGPLQADLDAGGRALTNVGTLTVTNSITAPSLTVTSTAALPASATLGGTPFGTAATRTATSFAPATSGSSLLAGNGTGGFSPVTLGANLTFSGGTLAASGGGGGSGTVTSVSTGNLAPLFTTSVTNSTTTPAVSYTLSSVPQYAVLNGPNVAGGGVPAYTIDPVVRNLTANAAVTSNNAMYAVRMYPYLLCGITGGTPTLSVGPGAGTTPTVSINGNHVAGAITVTTGTNPSAAAVIVSATLGVAFGNSLPPKVIIAPANDNAANLSGPASARIIQANVATNSFPLTAGPTPLAASTTYVWNYYLIQ